MWAIGTYSILGCFFGAFCEEFFFFSLICYLVRIIWLCLDPHNIWDFLPIELNIILYNIPFIFWLAIGWMMVLYWMDLQQSSGFERLQSLGKTRPYFIALIVGFPIVLFPIVLLEAFYSRIIAAILRNILIGLGMIAIVVISLVYGLRFLPFFFLLRIINIK